MDMSAVLTSLMPVIVGGLLTLAGGFVGHWLGNSLQARAEKNRRRAAKFEELITLLYEHEEWLGRLRDTRIYDEEEKDVGLSPMAKIVAIGAVYFPKFDKEIGELDIAADYYIDWMFTAACRKVDNPTSKYDEGGVIEHKEYIQKLFALIRELKQYGAIAFR